MELPLSKPAVAGVLKVSPIIAQRKTLTPHRLSPDVAKQLTDYPLLRAYVTPETPTI